MMESDTETSPRVEEGPKYKILVFQMNPHARPHLKIAQGLFGEEKNWHLDIAGLPARKAKFVPDVQEREKGADWLLKPDRFFKELGQYSA